MDEAWTRRPASRAARYRRRGPRRTGGSRPGPCRRARSGDRRGPGRLPAEGGPDRGGHAPRPGRVVGRNDRSRGGSRGGRRPRGSSRSGIRPGPGRAEPAAARAAARRPARGRERDDAVVVGDPQDRQPPAVVGRGRTAHPGAERPVADADVVLAQERRAGRRQAVGHGRRIARDPVRRVPGRSSGSAVGRGGRSAASACAVGGLGRCSRSSGCGRGLAGRDRLGVGAASSAASASRLVDGGDRSPQRPRSRPPAIAPASTASTACSAAIASTSAWRFATWASSSSRSISRRTSSGGGRASRGAPGRSSLRVVAADPRHAAAARLGLLRRGLSRMIASASIAVTPGTCVVALADQRRAAGRAGRLVTRREDSGAPHAARQRAQTPPSASRRRAWRTLYRVGRRRNTPMVRGARGPRRVRSRVIPTRSWPAAWS